MAKFESSDLKITVSVKWRIKQYLLSILRIIFYKAPPILGKGFRFLGRQLTSLGNLSNEEMERIRYIGLLRAEQNKPAQFGSPYGYKDDLQELTVAVKYRDEIANNFKKASASKVLYGHILDKCSSLLKEDSNIKDFVNFGVSYAYIDSVLAKEMPVVNFIGIDRSSFTKFFNESLFSDIKNMRFVAGDIYELLQSERFSGGVFFHMRTLALLPTRFNQDLYKAVFNAGFKYIVGLEPVGISRETLKAYEFSVEPKPSLLLRDTMFIHNYPSLLKQNNYSVLNIELIKSGHPHEDMRHLSFIAKRD